MAPSALKQPEIKAFFFLISSFLLHTIGYIYIWWNSPFLEDITIFSYKLTNIIYCALLITFFISLIFTRRIAAGGKFEYELLPSGKLLITLRSGTKSEISVKDKLVLITGGNVGIGYSTASYFANWGARVMILCRDEKRGIKAAQSLRKSSKNSNIEYFNLDLASFESIRNFARDWEKSQYPPIDILINNAGVMMCPFGLTKDGFELHFGTNHLGHFLLTKLLIPHMNQETGRIVNLSSYAHTFAPESTTITYNNLDERAKSTYDSKEAYAVSKLCNIFFTRKLQVILKQLNSHINTFAVHPGGVNTELTRYLPKKFIILLFPLLFLIFKRPKEGCQTTLFCALHPDAVPAEYYSDCKLGYQSKQTLNETEWDRLWEASEALTAPSQ